SPTRMSWITTAGPALAPPPFTVISKGPPAAPGFKYAFHLPRRLAVTTAFSLRKVTLTCSPGVARPHTCTGRSRCMTMWSEMTLGRVTCAEANEQENRTETSSDRQFNANSQTLRWLPDNIQGRNQQ